MTNEEKARELATKNYQQEINGGSSYTIAAVSALEMAEWKDQQFKEFLQNKKEEIAERLEYMLEEDARHFAFYQRYVCLGIIINELFGK